MNLFEAKQLLKKHGYRIIRENNDENISKRKAAEIIDSCFYIDSDFEGTSDYDLDAGEMPCPMVFVTAKSGADLDYIRDICDDFLIPDLESNSYGAIVGPIEGIYTDATDMIEFVFPQSEECDYSSRQEYENNVRQTLINAVCNWGHLFNLQ